MAKTTSICSEGSGAPRARKSLLVKGSLPTIAWSGSGISLTKPDPGVEGDKGADPHANVIYAGADEVDIKVVRV